jgi:dipeptidyl aminopeptidase/acylaminoacyl peptidase
MSTRPVKIEDLRKFRFVSDPQLSPDGKTIAFVVSDVNIEKDGYDRHVWLADVATGKYGQFTFGGGSETYPRWSPDGKKLLFLANGRQPGKKTQLYVMEVAGGEARLVADTELGVATPSWAPDSRRILFASKVWTEKKPETDVKLIKRIKYKLNGQGTFEGRRNHLFVVKPGAKAKQLTSGEFDVGTAAWSRDGKTVSFVTNMEKDADTSEVTDIYAVAATGGEQRKLTNGGFTILALSYSPDGQSIAFIGNDKPEELAVDERLWIMPAEGGAPRRAAPGFKRSLGYGVGSDLRVASPDQAPVWSHDNAHIYFYTSDTQRCSLYRTRLSDGKTEVVIGKPSVDGFSVAGDTIAYVAMDATHPDELYVRDTRGDRRITRFNDDLLKKLQIVEPVSFRFRSSIGRDVEAWVVKPPTLKRGERCPAVLEIHGGPRALFGDGIFHEFHVLAGEGIAVIYTNPRGSAGYEESFTQGVMRHYGEGDYEDLMACVDEAVKRFPWIDANRLGVCGGSYGGYMANWMITQTNRFKAAVTFRSICNWISKFGTSDIGYFQPESISGAKTHWGEDTITQMKHSPLYYVDRVETPTLIVHSEDDLRCPIEQGEQWFTALKLRGVETEFVRIPGENHELSRSGKPKHREERLSHLVRWMKKYLQS